MNTINEFARNVILCVLIINTIDNMIVTENYKKYIKLFTGILVIIVILNSLSFLSMKDFKLNMNKIGREYEEYNYKYKKNIRNMYRNVVKDNEIYIKEYIEKNMEDIRVKDVRIIIKGEKIESEIEKIYVRIKIKERVSGKENYEDIDDLKGRINKQIRTIICKEYSVKENKIEIENI